MPSPFTQASHPPSPDDDFANPDDVVVACAQSKAAARPIHVCAGRRETETYVVDSQLDSHGDIPSHAQRSEWMEKTAGRGGCVDCFLFNFGFLSAETGICFLRDVARSPRDDLIVRLVLNACILARSHARCCAVMIACLYTCLAEGEESRWWKRCVDRLERSNEARATNAGRCQRPCNDECCTDCPTEVVRISRSEESVGKKASTKRLMHRTTQSRLPVPDDTVSAIHWHLTAAAQSRSVNLTATAPSDSPVSSSSPSSLSPSRCPNYKRTDCPSCFAAGRLVASGDGSILTLPRHGSFKPISNRDQGVPWGSTNVRPTSNIEISFGNHVDSQTLLDFRLSDTKHAADAGGEQFREALEKTRKNTDALSRRCSNAQLACVTDRYPTARPLNSRNWAMTSALREMQTGSLG
ncbi:hypothetical protein BKA81DRAFT_417356 [Phyllosticta paracitricarpa]|uniref:Uncharacterized protein n=1 Tax=Phyllosticta citricarpa TaxID=55181 RepID=A0ABR1M2G3_9PEZI